MANRQFLLSPACKVPGLLKKAREYAIVADKVRAAGHFFGTPGLQRVLVAFGRALAARGCSKLEGRRSVVKGGKLALGPGQPKYLPAVPVVSMTVVEANAFVFLLESRRGLEAGRRLERAALAPTAVPFVDPMSQPFFPCAIFPHGLVLSIVPRRKCVAFWCDIIFFPPDRVCGRSLHRLPGWETLHLVMNFALCWHTAWCVTKAILPT
uniref:Uncharacterized protein n=1 Tax=Ixodes ricinus TaxID=34613 RepID=A0A6B0V310_IXORI